VTATGRRRFPRPLLWAIGAVLVVGLAVVGLVAVVSSSLQEVADLEAEDRATTAVAPEMAAEGEVTVRLDATARPVDGDAPNHVGVQPFVDLDASELRGPVRITLEAQGTESGPIEPMGEVAASGADVGNGDPAAAWSAAAATSVQEVVDPGSGRFGLGSVKVVLPCPLGEACTARWRYRIEPLGGDPGDVTLMWGVGARVAYSRGDQTRRTPEGATVEVVIGDAQPVTLAAEPVVLETADLADGSTLTARGPFGSDAVVRATLLDGANGTAPGFVLAPAEGIALVQSVGPSIWEAPLAVGTCDVSACTLRIRVQGTPPPGSTLRVDARAAAPLGAPPIDDQVAVTIVPP